MTEPTPDHFEDDVGWSPLSNNNLLVVANGTLLAYDLPQCGQFPRACRSGTDLYRLLMPRRLRGWSSASSSRGFSGSATNRPAPAQQPYGQTGNVRVSSTCLFSAGRFHLCCPLDQRPSTAAISEQPRSPCSTACNLTVNQPRSMPGFLVAGQSLRGGIIPKILRFALPGPVVPCPGHPWLRPVRPAIYAQ